MIKHQSSNGVSVASIMKIYIFLYVVCLSKEALSTDESISNGASITVRGQTIENSFLERDSSTTQYGESTNHGDSSKACQKNPLRAAFEAFMSNLSGSCQKEQTRDSLSGCENDKGTFIPKILKDLINFVGHLMKADWNHILLGPTWPYVNLLQRYHTWSNSYNSLRKKLEQDHKSNNNNDLLDQIYNAMKIDSREIFKINYAKYDNLLANSRRTKHINQAKENLKESLSSQGEVFTTTSSLIDSTGHINKKVLDGLLLDEERMNFLLELLTKVLETLEQDLVKNKQLYNDYLRETGRAHEIITEDDGNKDKKIEEDGQTYQNCLEKFSHEEKIIVKKLESSSTDNVIASGNTESSPEQTTDCLDVDGQESHFNEAMNRLARIARNELIETIKRELIILAQFYFINSLGFGGYKDNLEQAYICTIKGRLLGDGFFHLFNNVPGLKQWTDNTFSVIHGATSKLMPRHAPTDNQFTHHHHAN